MARRKSDIQISDWHPPTWNAESDSASLEGMRQYAESNAQAAIDWYYQKKTGKAMTSQVLRAFAIVATAAGGLIPILVATGVFDLPNSTAVDLQLRHAHIHQIGYVCIGFAALAIAFDRFFGNSTGWMRYILTAMSLETALMQFRVDWARLTSSVRGAISTDELEILIKRISDFVVTVRTLVENETKQWVLEFQTNLSELEKETKTAMEAARTSSEQSAKETASLRPGAIELVVENAADTDAGYTAEIDGKVSKSGMTSRTCGIREVPPGLHEVAVSAAIGGVRAHALQVVPIAPNAVTKVNLQLAKGKAA